MDIDVSYIISCLPSYNHSLKIHDHIASHFGGRFLHHERRRSCRRRLHPRRPHPCRHLPSPCPYRRARPEGSLGRARRAVVCPLALLGLWHRYPHRAREGPRRAGIGGAAAALRSTRQGRARLLQGPGADSHCDFRERGRPPQHRPARHRPARGEVRATVSPGQARGGDRAGRCAAREPRSHLLARGRRHRGVARTVPAGDGCTHPERARCGDDRARGGAARGGVGRRRQRARGRPTWDVGTGVGRGRCGDRDRCARPRRCGPETGR